MVYQQAPRLLVDTEQGASRQNVLRVAGDWYMASGYCCPGRVAHSGAISRHQAKRTARSDCGTAHPVRQWCANSHASINTYPSTCACANTQPNTRTCASTQPNTCPCADTKADASTNADPNASTGSD